MNPKQQSTARLEQASLWWLRLREDDVRPEEISEWLAWCQQDSANLEAFEKIEGLGVRLGALDEDQRNQVSREVLEPLPSVPVAPATARTVARGRRRWPLWTAAAAVVVLAVSFVVLAPRMAPPSAVEPVMSYETVKAQTRDVTLSDGSQVAIGADTRVDVQYSSDRRRLSLGDGEAYFQVAHNPQRPFVVQVGELRVTAVGTAFNIRKTGGRVEVVVTKGIVDVAGAGVADGSTQAGDGGIRVPAGRLVVSEDQRLTVTPADSEAAIAWRHGSQRFVDENLGVVVANLNRYSHDEVVIDDPRIKSLRYTGTVLEGHEHEWLAAIEKVFPVVVQHQDGRVVLKHRDA
ncbi:FecR family protein [Solimonas marina]|uniref:DUF4880 domain-containing protein n=1 Tax=Solimonas marina TaxID=2714601 RepID=A0A969WC76_9GAMM|nr:FecR domain-containing protein [Solimonas marina]NKF23878.1 DUF4880 domain-containing protein [Solimonas marina]